MRNSLRKLRGFSLIQKNFHGGGSKLDPKQIRNLAQLDELTQASQDMEEMRYCYDALLSAASATSNSVDDLSESFREMGFCLQQKSALEDNEENGEVLSMLGKVQFELQTHVDHYRSHVFQTIINPSESLLSELQIVEEMRRQCEEKRDAYEYISMRYKEKGRSKCGKSDRYTMEHLREAFNEFDEEATLFIFRMRSMKQGQSRSLVTQAVRHHAAQLSFFRKALKSLEAIEPHVKMVAEMQHIHYHFRGLEDDNNDEEDSNDSNSDVKNDGELSLDDLQIDHERNSFPTSQYSMELERINSRLREDAIKGNANRGRPRHKHCFSMGEDFRHTGSPFAGDGAKYLQRQPSLTRKLNTYALPTPFDIQKTGSPSPTSKTCKTDDKPSPPRLEGNQTLDTTAGLRTSRSSLAQGAASPKFNTVSRIAGKKLRRQTFSDTLSNKQWPALSGSALQDAVPQSWSSPKVSPTASPKISLPPTINELHALPMPPAGIVSGLSRTSDLVAHSGPLTSPRSPAVSNATQLPKPPPALARSFSIPSSAQRSTETQKFKELKLEVDEDSVRVQHLL